MATISDCGLGLPSRLRFVAANVASRLSQAMKVGGDVMLGQGRMRVVRIARLMREPDSSLLIVILLVKQ